ncbi:hypothetical protein [Haloarcula salinisoli]|uniref:Uncharacterized protein n=1 Tax=Haloarcula salinisoli TaxID=2487746 RepID=A0A8J8CCK8_9EURY|nr:hypothetical protein [Halomicroarcula salinisoli]MBX0284912.1 hypothetical protein [Halomicroarcula salinisoli]MBX0303610.1 hypothetical protein [Halomicroarcula salinisoli]
MPETLELPNGDEVTPEDVFLYNDYPYRLVWLDSEDHAFELSPLYWGDSGMDIPFRDREALVDQWEPESRGVLSAEEWADWLDEASDDPRFDDEELAELAAELPTDWDHEPATDDDGGLLDRFGL